MFGKAHVGVPTPTLVYVMIDDRAVFDAIQGEARETKNETKHVITKSVGEIGNGVAVIFQHWPQREDAPAI